MRKRKWSKSQRANFAATMLRRKGAPTITTARLYRLDGDKLIPCRIRLTLEEIK